MEGYHNPDPFSSIYGSSMNTSNNDTNTGFQGPTNNAADKSRPHFLHLRQYSNDSGISRASSSSASVTIRPGQYYDQGYPPQPGQASFTPTSDISVIATPPNVAKTNQDGTDPPFMGVAGGDGGGGGGFEQLRPLTRKLPIKGATFITKLFMDDPNYSHLLRWGDDGKQVIIVNPFELEASVLPRIYKQSKFSSFSRQLNVSMRDKHSPDGDMSSWVHSYLNKWSTDEEVIGFRRRLPGQQFARAGEGGVKEEGSEATPAAGPGPTRRSSQSKHASRTPGTGSGTPQSPASLSGSFRAMHHHSPYNSPRPIGATSTAAAGTSSASGGGSTTPGTAVLVRDPATGIFRWATATMPAAATPGTPNAPSASPLSPGAGEGGAMEGSRQEVAQAWAQAMRNQNSNSMTGGVPVSAPAWRSTFPSGGTTMHQQQQWSTSSPASTNTTTLSSSSYPYPATPWSFMQQSNTPAQQGRMHTPPTHAHATKPYEYFASPQASYAYGYAGFPGHSFSSIAGAAATGPGSSTSFAQRRTSRHEPHRRTSLNIVGPYGAPASATTSSSTYSGSGAGSALPAPRHEILSQVVPQAQQAHLGFGLGLEGLGSGVGLGLSVPNQASSMPATGGAPASSFERSTNTMSTGLESARQQATAAADANTTASLNASTTLPHAIVLPHPYRSQTYGHHQQQHNYGRSYTPSPPMESSSTSPRYHVAFGNTPSTTMTSAMRDSVPGAAQAAAVDDRDSRKQQQDDDDDHHHPHECDDHDERDHDERDEQHNDDDDDHDHDHDARDQDLTMTADNEHRSEQSKAKDTTTKYEPPETATNVAASAVLHFTEPSESLSVDDQSMT